MPTTKEETLRLVLRNLIKLQNEFHVPLLFAYYSKIGIVPFGSEGLKRNSLMRLRMKKRMKNHGRKHLILTKTP